MWINYTIVTHDMLEFCWSSKNKNKIKFFLIQLTDIYVIYVL